MPDFPGTLNPPRLAAAPASPQLGQMYYNTVANILYYWNGTQWVSTQSTSGTIYDSDQVGTVKSFSGQTIPTNWMLADGRSLLRVDYPQLFAAIGTAYGSADVDHFNLPDLRSKFIYGATTPAGAGGVGGEASHLLTAAESGVPVHGHADTFAIAAGNIGQAAGWNLPVGDSSWSRVGVSGPSTYGNIAHHNTGTISYTSGSHSHTLNGAVSNNAAANAAAAHNNLPPYVLMAHIIKVTGVQVDSGGALVGATGPAGLTGPQGPQGVQGPQGDVGPGGLLNVQRITGTDSVYVPLVNGQELYTSSAKNVPLRLYYTPTVDCWWEVYLHVATLQKTDAAYHYSQMQLAITPADVDGLTTATTTLTQHSTVQTFEPRTSSMLFKLQGGVAYRTNVSIGISGGTWQYHTSSNSIILFAKAWAR